MTERSHEVKGLGSELFYGSRYHAPTVHVCLERIVAQVTSTWSQQPLQGVLDPSFWQISAVGWQAGGVAGGDLGIRIIDGRPFRNRAQPATVTPRDIPILGDWADPPSMAERRHTWQERRRPYKRF